MYIYNTYIHIHIYYVKEFKKLKYKTQGEDVVESTALCGTERCKH